MIVELPDGRTVEFPDSMSEADVNKVLSTEASHGAAPATTPPTGTPPATGPRSPGGYVAARAARGLQDFNLGMTAGGQMSSGMFSPWTDPNQIPEDRSGSLIDPGTAPGPTSRILGGAAEGITSNPLLAAIAPEASLLGGAGGEAGAMLTGESTLGRVAGGLIGGSLGQAARSAVRWATGAGSLSKITSELGEAKTYQQAGERLQAHVGDWIEALPSKLKNVYSTVDDLMHGRGSPGTRGVAPTLATTEQTGQTLGAPAIPARSASFAETEAGLPATPTVANEPLTQTTVTSPGVPGIPDVPAMPQGPKTPLPATAATVDRLLNSPELEGFGKASSKLGSGRFAGFLDELKNSGMVSADSRKPAQPQSWDAVRALSSKIGGLIDNPKNFINTDEQAAAKALYASLMSDQRATVLAHQGEAGVAAFDEAQARASQLLSTRDRLNSFVEPGVDPEKAAKLALAGSGAKGGGSTLATLREHVPDATNELAAAHLEATPKDWAKLSPEAKAGLVPELHQRERIDEAVRRQFPQVRNPLEKTDKGILGAITIGPAVAEGVNMLLGGPHGAGAAVGPMVGAMWPYATAGVKHLATNPSLLTGPVVGADAARRAGPRANLLTQ